MSIANFAAHVQMERTYQAMLCDLSRESALKALGVRETTVKSTDEEFLNSGIPKLIFQEGFDNDRYYNDGGFLYHRYFDGGRGSLRKASILGGDDGLLVSAAEDPKLGYLDLYQLHIDKSVSKCDPRLVYYLYPIKVDSDFDEESLWYTVERELEKCAAWLGEPVVDTDPRFVTFFNEKYGEVARLFPADKLRRLIPDSLLDADGHDGVYLAMNVSRTVTTNVREDGECYLPNFDENEDGYNMKMPDIPEDQCFIVTDASYTTYELDGYDVSMVDPSRLDDWEGDTWNGKPLHACSLLLKQIRIEDLFNWEAIEEAPEVELHSTRAVKVEYDSKRRVFNPVDEDGNKIDLCPLYETDMQPGTTMIWCDGSTHRIVNDYRYRRSAREEIACDNSVVDSQWFDGL